MPCVWVHFYPFKYKHNSMLDMDEIPGLLYELMDTLKRWWADIIIKLHADSQEQGTIYIPRHSFDHIPFPSCSSFNL